MDPNLTFKRTAHFKMMTLFSLGTRFSCYLENSRFAGQNEHKAAAEIMVRGLFQMHIPDAYYKLKKDKNIRLTVDMPLARE